ncbi:MAG: formate dehydrogenase accessory sulfurtransferase FdhD [Candidatus Bathyarchaeota archaeon]|nr:formate dehydrogenase accessory sulfurtransferase FdhD [Candidatus Bathyarchaeota archaeon]
MRQVEILRLDLSTGQANKVVDHVAVEVPLQISVNKTYSYIIWCSPLQYKELAVGYLIAEDILKSVDEISDINLNETNRICNVTLKPEINVDERMNYSRRHTRVIPLLKASTSPYQRKEKTPVITSDFKVKAQVLVDSINDMNKRATGFMKTGGLHDSAIYRGDGSLVAFSEDVGRHNTVDKVIGTAALNHVDLSECFMSITGRVPGDMIFKAAKAGLPLVASMAAVLSSGVATANEANIALVGFVRGKRMNIYTGAQRIII